MNETSGRLPGRRLCACERSGDSVSRDSVSGRAVCCRAVCCRAVSGRAVCCRAVSGRAVCDRAVSGRAVCGRAVCDRAVSGDTVGSDAARYGAVLRRPPFGIPRFLHFIAVCFMSVVFQSCMGPSSGDDVPMADQGRVVAADRIVWDSTTFSLGRQPFSNPTEMVAAHRPVLDALARSLGCKSAYLVTAPDYAGVFRLLLDRKVDAAWVGTVAYLHARMNHLPVTPLVCPVRRGKRSYRGAIICRKEAPFKSLTDLKGRSIAFVEPSSASGYLFPCALLSAAGLRLPDDIKKREHGEVDFLGKHDSVVFAVYLGKYDAGAVFDGAPEQVFRDSPEKAAELRVIARTAEILNEPVVVRKDLPGWKKEMIEKAFLSIRFPPGGAPAGLGGLESFVPVSDADYDEVVETLRKSGHGSHSALRLPMKGLSMPDGGDGANRKEGRRP